jgi:hypothetical protein
MIVPLWRATNRGATAYVRRVSATTFSAIMLSI